jgi:hypothetical protein
VRATISRIQKGLCLVAAFWVVPCLTWCQENRLNGLIESQKTARLPGSVHPLAQAKYDQGPADPALEMTPLTLVLKRSAAQQAALDKVLQEQQDPASPNYHRWLTPAEFGQRFGFSQSDINGISDWLKSQGFTVVDVPASRNMIVFSGTVQTVQAAFRTSIHRYEVEGEKHIANSEPPSLPVALARVVLAITGLDDFQPKPHHRKLGGAVRPDFTANDGSHYLSPGDYAVIYDILPLYQATYTGAGQSIAVVGRCKIGLSDVRTFRSNFGLPANDPNVILASGSAVPAQNSGDCGEAYLDVEWSGAVAYGATINYIYATDVFYAVQYAVTQNIAPIITMSFGLCEQNAASSSGSASAESFTQQANAQGITWLASSGDSGSAGCDAAFSSTSSAASNGLGVNFPASIPEVTAVGGTEFNEGSGTYWNTNNSAAGVSAQSYIPEMAWNESGPNGLASSGGGLSVFYPKPAWQIGPGVPSQNHRAVPDVALTAAGHDGYIVTMNGNLSVFSGTSAASPSFAGILAILNQYQVAQGFQAQPGQGNINPNLYRLAQSAPSAFNDVVSGNNVVPCAPGSPDCTTGSFGYNAGRGYDLVTGLGSVNAANLVQQWSNKSVNTTTNVSASPTSFPLSGTVQLTATVSAVGSSAIPSGTVSFQTGNTSLGSASLVRNGNSAKATVTAYGSQYSAGPNTVTASYGGGPSLNGSSGTTNVTVTQPSTNAAIIPSAYPNPVFQEPPDADGYTFFFTVTVSEVTGVGTTLTSFTFNGSDYSSQIASFFGGTTLPPHGSLSAVLGAKSVTVPSVGVFQFGGSDANGHAWKQQLSLPFYGPQITAIISLASVPVTVHQDPSASPDCQWTQNLVLQELNGHNVQLQHFLSAGADYSSQIQAFFGSNQLPAYGFLEAGVCWTGITPPENITIEMDGTDDTGKLITTTTPVLFDVPSTSGSVLSVDNSNVALSVSDPSQSTSTQIQVNVANGQQWVARIFPANQQGSWLTANPLSGIGPGSVTVSVSGTPYQGPTLTNGTYNGSLVIESENSRPQFINIPVTFTVGASTLTSFQMFPHVASDNQWHTDIFVLNTNSTATTFTLAFNTDSGAPVPLDGNPQTSNVTLPPNGVAFFRTSAAASPNNGWAELDATAPMSGVAVFGRHGDDGRYYEASVQLSAPYQAFTVPFDETVSLLGTPFLNGFAVTNSDPNNTAQMNCSAYASDGTSLGSGLPVGPLNPLQHTAFLIDQQFGAALAGQRGTLTCQSTTLVGAVELRAISSSPAVSSMPVITNITSGNSTVQIFPHVASDTQWHTDIFVVNNSNAPVTFSLVFHTDSGAPLPLDGSPATANVTLQPNAVAFFRTSPASGENSGWAELNSSAPLFGVAVFGRYGDDGGYYEASVPLSAPYSSFTVPFDETQSPLGAPFLDGFAVANSDSSNAAQMSCTAYDSGGNVLGSNLPVGPLNPLQHTAFLIDQQFGSLTGQLGTLTCQSNTLVGAVELRAISSSPAVSSMPVIPNDGTATSAISKGAKASNGAKTSKAAKPSDDSTPSKPRMRPASSLKRPASRHNRYDPARRN